MDTKKQTLCVINGGGLRQIECATGCLKALQQLGVQPDCYWGSSAGAAIAGLMASGLSAAELETIIRKTRVSDLYQPYSKWRQLLGFIPGYTPALLNPDGMYRLLSAYITPQAMEKALVTVTRCRDGKSMRCGATAKTIMASAAIPCVFPPVEINGVRYEDGGVKNMIPTPKISEIDTYEHIYFILCNSDINNEESSGMLAKAVEAFSRTMDREEVGFFEAGWAELPNVTVIKPTAYPSSLLEWSDCYGLINHAYEYTLFTMQTNAAITGKGAQQ